MYPQDLETFLTQESGLSVAAIPLRLPLGRRMYGTAIGAVMARIPFLIIVLVLLVIFTQGSALAPFIYSLF